MTDNANSWPSKRSLVLTALIALAVVIVDGWMLFPGPGIVLAILVVTGSLLVALYRLFSKPKQAVLPLYRAGVFVLSIVMIWMSYQFHVQVAKSRLQTVVTAIDAYRKETGTYPNKLEALVPEYIAKLPPATFHLNPALYELRTDRQTGKHVLAWPIHLRTELEYDFDQGSWTRQKLE